MPKISVIIPVYNVEKYLPRCLDSIINQTLNDIEIICVNDGSTDSSKKILNEYAKKDNRIKIISQINSGLSEARNAGIRIAKGDFIGLVDSDDYIDINFYEKLYNAAIDNNADIACGGIIRIGEKRKKVFINYEYSSILSTIKEKFELSGLPEYNFVWNKIYKREALINSNVEFIRGILYEDMFFTPDILERMGTLVTVPNVFYYYWINKNSIIVTATDKNRHDKIEANKYLLEKCRKHNVNIPINRDFIRKEEYFLFGIKILKVYVGRATKTYYLFGLIPFLEMRAY